MFILVLVLFIDSTYANGNDDFIVRETFENSLIDNRQLDFAEHECKLVEDFMFENTCDGRSCWESQLRNTTRFKILQLYNDIRTEITKGHHGCCPVNPTNELEWHWRLELETRKKLRNCPVYEHEKDVIMILNAGGTKLVNDSKENDTMMPFYCDIVTTSFACHAGSQNELISLLPKLIGSNYFRDFDTRTNRFKRQNAVYLGCSYVPRHGVSTVVANGQRIIDGGVGHLSCMFCAPEKPVFRVHGNCPKYTRKISSNSNLCKFIRKETEMPCELNKPRCPLWEQRGPSWMSGELGRVETQNDTDDDWQVLPMGFSPPASKDEYESSRSDVERNVRYIYAYVTMRDPYDRKFCILLAVAFILIVCMLVLVLILIYRRRFLDKKYS